MDLAVVLILCLLTFAFVWLFLRAAPDFRDLEPYDTHTAGEQLLEEWDE